MSKVLVPISAAFRALSPKRLVIAFMAALLLLSGVFNLRPVIDGGGGQSWEANPAAPSAAHQLAGAPVRPPSRLDGQILSLQDTLREDSDNGSAATRLGQAYMQKALVTGDPSYYPKAEALFAKALEVEPTDFAAMVGQGTVALGRHRFADALDWGERARSSNPHNAAAYGVIGDAQLELGRYPEAIATFQAMVDLRPDLSSFARVAYARELTGDPAGAIEAMELAATAGASSAENFAWVQGQLGDLYFDRGNLLEAEKRYRSTLAVFPDYVDGLAGLGRIAAARGDIAGAIDNYTAAVRSLPVPEFVIALGDNLLEAGRMDEAAKQFALVPKLQALYTTNGVHTDLEIALFDAEHGGDLSGAVARAQAGFARQPSVTAADVLSWTLYLNGQFEAAGEMSREALHLGTQDALMLFHAGMIEARLGKTEAAVNHLQSALRINPYFSVQYARQARDTLRELGVETPPGPTGTAQA